MGRPAVLLRLSAGVCDCGCADDEKEKINQAAAPGSLHAKRNWQRSIDEVGKRSNEADRMPREIRRHVDSRWTEI